MSGKVQAPPFNYLGSKWKLASWIISHFPPHKVYVEPFGGIACVLLRKPPSVIEVYNDLNCALVAFFQVLRDPNLYSELIERLYFTPYSRVVWKQACQLVANTTQLPEDPQELVELAWACATCYAQSYGGVPRGWNSKGTSHLNKWLRLARLADTDLTSSLVDVAERFRKVIIECRDALEIMKDWDGPDVLMYLDPPYPHKTRTGKGEYHIEQEDDFHHRLLELAVEMKSFTLLSTYPNQLYTEFLSQHGWGVARKNTRAVVGTHCGHTKEVVEELWYNPRVKAWLEKRRLL